MASQNITVNSQEVAGIVDKIKELTIAMQNDTRAYGAAFSVVQQRNANINQVNEIVQISEAVVQDINELNEALDLLVDGVRKFEEQMREAFSGTVGDI